MKNVKLKIVECKHAIHVAIAYKCIYCDSILFFTVLYLIIPVLGVSSERNWRPGAIEFYEKSQNLSLCLIRPAP